MRQWEGAIEEVYTQVDFGRDEMQSWSFQAVLNNSYVIFLLQIYKQMFVVLPYTEDEQAVTKEDSNFCGIVDLSKNLKCLSNVHFDDEMY